MDKARRLFSGLALCGSFLSCSGGSSRPALSPEPAPLTATAHFPDEASQPVRSRALDFPIELQLPSKASWQVSDGPQWFELHHAPTSSALALRTWRAERLVRRRDCETQARLERPAIPAVHDEAVVDRRPFSGPADFDTELVVGVEPSPRGIAGYAIVIGASVGRCYAAVFTTEVRGAAAEAEVAARLGVVVDRILSSVRLRSVDERAVRRRLIATPSAR